MGSVAKEIRPKLGGFDSRFCVCEPWAGRADCRLFIDLALYKLPQMTKLVDAKIKLVVPAAAN